MTATRLWAGALASALFAVSSASAQYPSHYVPGYSPVTHRPLGFAPDACGPGFYSYCPCTCQVYGPNYCLRPCFEPYNGVRPHVQCIDGKCVAGPSMAQQPSPGYTYHPYARSPRDFFMFRDEMEEQQSRQARPQLVP